MYTRERIHKLLLEYQRLAIWGRLPSPDDRLASGRPLPTDGYLPTLAMKTDLEMALQSLPFMQQMALFMAVCLGGSSWRSQRHAESWRSHVAEWWEISGAELNRIVNEAEEMLYCELNGLDRVDATVAVEAGG